MDVITRSAHQSSKVILVFCLRSLQTTRACLLWDLKLESEADWISIFYINFSVSETASEWCFIRKEIYDFNENILWHKSRRLFLSKAFPEKGKRLKPFLPFSTRRKKNGKMRYIKSICCFPLHKSSSPLADTEMQRYTRHHHHHIFITPKM